MEVVLLKEVERLGQEGAVVRVSPGFARNYLLPRALAVPASPERVRQMEEIKRQRARKLMRVKMQAESLKRRLEGRSLTLKLSLGEADKPFGAITSHDVIETLKREGIELEKTAVHLDEPIKTLGIYDIPVRVHPEVTATLKLWVVKA